MPMAARVTSLTGHGTPLTPGPGCPTVLIGGFPAWRALPAAMASAVQSSSNVMNSFMVRPQMTPADGTASLVQISQSLAQQGAAAAGAGAPAAAATAGSMVAVLNTTNVALTAVWTAASAVPGGQPAANIAYTEGVKAAAAAAASAVMASMASLSDIHICPIPVPIPPHGPGFVTNGSTTVLIGNLSAARQGDQVFEACGGPDPIAMGCPTVMIGDSGGGGASSGAGAAAGGAAGAGAAGAAAAKAAAEADTIAKAIAKIENSAFGKTDEGKKVVAKLKELQKAGKIKFKKLKDTTRGDWGSGEIGVNDKYAGDVDSTASELVHEATHAVNEDDFPASKTKLTIDEEMRTNTNQLEFYKEQKADGYNDPELDRRLAEQKKGKLRDDVRKRYPGTPEHL